MHRLLHILATALRTAPTYCGPCGWWVENCPHQN